MTEHERSGAGGVGSLTRRGLLFGAGGVGAVVIGRWLYGRAGNPANVKAASEKLPDGRPRLPPGQHVLQALKPMGGTPGDPQPSRFRLRVHGEVKNPFEIDYRELLAMPQTEQACDVHCVTTWSLLDGHWTGVRLSELAERAGVRDTARYVIFEAAADYTSNIDLESALKPNVLVAHRHQGDPLGDANGAPVRALVPDRYFWKSAKWLTGIRFQAEDEPGFWEVRGYNNHADPWKEERYSEGGGFAI
jgi:DMSO/TMAO reductase YedYZ molybdopterin-dependent catalytic subunit